MKTLPLLLICIFSMIDKSILTESCCRNKSVGGHHYTLVKELDTSQFGCYSKCIYIKEGGDEKFCFKFEELEVDCHDGKGCQ